MIGGFDTVLMGQVTPRDDLDVLLRAVRALWPSAVVECGDGSSVLRIFDALRHSNQLPAELFVYPSRDAYESWTSSGLTDENEDKIIAITIEPDCICFVASSPSGPTGAIVEMMKSAVTNNRWLALAKAA